MIKANPTIKPIYKNEFNWVKIVCQDVETLKLN